MKLKRFSHWCSVTGFVLLTGCTFSTGWNAVDGNGRLASESRPVSDFNQVSICGPGELALCQGTEEGLTIETDENLLPLIKTEVRNGHLYIGPKNVNVRPSQSIRYALSVKRLKALGLSGSLHASTGAVRTESLALHISGSGAIDLAQLEAKTLSADISGSGRTAVAGKVERQRVHISGSGRHSAPELACDQAAAQISGSGRATLWAKANLEAQISGSGRVEYYGSPQVDSHVSGSGRVSALGAK